MDSKLQEHRIFETPPNAYYIPNFVTKEEASFLLEKVYSSPLPKWTQLSHRRLQNWGGLPHPKGMVVEPLPKWLQECCSKVAALGVFEHGICPNHVLVNEYTPGQGIMPHEDGPLYSPTVATISLGSHTLLDFYSPITTVDTVDQECSQGLSSCYLFSLLLEPGSLLVLQEEMYMRHLHGIAERKEDMISKNTVANLAHCRSQVKDGDTLERTTRVSLTIRYVPKTLKLKLKLGK